MASQQEEVNYAVAKALGYEVVSANKADSGTFTVGVKYLFAVAGELFTRPQCDCPWSPATNPADALACLEEWAVQHKRSVKFWFDIGKRTRRLAHVCIIEGTVATDGESFCEAACQAIIHAEAGK